MTVPNISEAVEKQLKDYPVALDPVQVAEILGVTRRYVDQLLDEGKIPYFPLNEDKQYQQKRVLKANLIAFMVRNQNNNVGGNQ
jgi:thymidylate synthase ThyX